jgi:hypothetical protein
MNGGRSDGKARVYRLNHSSPFAKGEFETGLRFVLLAHGYAYGDVPRNAGRGDMVSFTNGDTAPILSVCVMEMNTKLARTLCAMRYGADMADVYRKWVERAVGTGAKRGAVSSETCLFLWHGEKIEEETSRGR